MYGRDVYIAGTGSFSPGEPVPFDQIEDVLGKITEAPPKLMKRIDRMRPLMKEMLGIEYSHYAIDPKTRRSTENNTSMSTKAAQEALQKAGIEANDIDLIAYGGILFDSLCPPQTVFIQEALNIRYCAEISVHSNCTSSYKAFQIATDMIANGRYRNALVISSQLSSTFLRAEYFNQKKLTEEQVILRWFLSDGASALVLSADRPKGVCLKVRDTYLESVGVGIEPTMRMLIGAAESNLPFIYENGLHHLTQDISTVAKIGHDLFRDGFHKMIEKAPFDLGRVKCFFANIPTKHFLDMVMEKLRTIDFKDESLPFYSKLGTRGYQGPPAVFIGLDDYLDEARHEPGDLLVSFVTESSKWMHAGFVLEYC